MNVFFNFDPAHYIYFNDYSVGDFHTIKIVVEYDEGTLRYTSANVYVDDNFEADLNIYGGILTEISYFSYSLGNINTPYTIAFDNFRVFEPPLPPASLNITSPVAGTEMTETFNIDGDFDIQAEEWDRIGIWLVERDELSICPLYGTPEWEAEEDLGYFHFGTPTYWSDVLGSPSGNFSVPISGAVSGNYNCIECHFFNTDLQLFSDEKCNGYNLIVSGNIDPDIPVYIIPFSDWFDYYSANSPEFPVPTSIFNEMAETISPVIDKLGGAIIYVKDYFNSDEAVARGTELGQAIPKARGYLSMIDDFVNLPISAFISFYFLTLAVVISYKIILRIIGLLKP